MATDVLLARRGHVITRVRSRPAALRALRRRFEFVGASGPPYFFVNTLLSHPQFGSLCILSMTPLQPPSVAATVENHTPTPKRRKSRAPHSADTSFAHAMDLRSPAWQTIVAFRTSFGKGFNRVLDGSLYALLTSFRLFQLVDSPQSGLR